MLGAALVFVGGGLGAVLRYLVFRLIDGDVATEDAEGGRFPFATFTVNVIGSLVLGLLAGLSTADAGPIGSPQPRLVLATGILGGFTTFSTLSLDTLTLTQSGQYFVAITYISTTCVVGLAAAAIGFTLGRVFTVY